MYLVDCRRAKHLALLHQIYILGLALMMFIKDNPLLAPAGPLSRLSEDLASRTCLASPLCGILDTWPNQCGCGLSVETSGSTFRALQISQLRTLLCNVPPGS